MRIMIPLLMAGFVSGQLFAQQGAPVIPSSFQLTSHLEIPDQGSSFLSDNLEVADLDGDGKPDLVTGLRTTTGIISVFRNVSASGDLSNESFESRVDLSTDDGDISTPYINGLDLADFDGDGRPDILFGSNCLVNHVGIIRNITSAGSLAPSDFSLPFYFEAPGCPTDVSAADMDGDGKPDIIVSRANSPQFSMYILRNTSTPGSISFEKYLQFETIATRGRLHTSDLDNDGKPEILVGYSGGTLDHISVFRNTSSPGVISLAPRREVFVGTGANPWHIATGDMDNDGKTDVVVSNRGSGAGVSVLKNASTTGNLLLTVAEHLPKITESAGQQGPIHVADANGDGLPDIIGSVINVAETGIVQNITGRNGSDGAMFSTPTSFGFPVGTPSSYSPVKVIDLNADGRPDLISMRRNGIWIHQSKLEHAPVIRSISSYRAGIGDRITISGEYFARDAADNLVRFGQVVAVETSVNGDALDVTVPPGASLDYITVTTNGLTAVSPEMFNPTFSPGSAFDLNSFSAPVSFTLGRMPQNLSISDLDLDGRPDVVVAMNNIGLLRNTATQGIVDGTSLTMLPEISLGAASVNSIGLYDISGDGKPDVLRNSSSAPGIFQNVSTGAAPSYILFGPHVATGVSTNDAGLGIPAYDVNLDGKIDLAYAGPSREINLVLNQQRTDLLNATTLTGLKDLQTASNPITILSGAVQPGGVAAGDFDGDGRMDLCVVLPADNKVVIARNTTQSAGMPVKHETFDLPADGNIVAVETVDIDGDGLADLAVTSQATGTLSIFYNQSTPGNLSFQKSDLEADIDPTLVRAGDLDGDGKPDLICIYRTRQKFSIFRNISGSSPEFGPRIDYDLVSAPRGLDIGDIDLDGKPDILIGQASQIISVFKNQIGAISPIRIDQQPVNEEVCVSDNAAFSVQASGVADLQYQWQEDSGSGFIDLINNTRYDGADTPTLTISNATAAQTGRSYRCRIFADNGGTVTSEQATLTVNMANAPEATDAGSCEPDRLTLTATGGDDGDYRWYASPSGSLPIDGEISSTYTTPFLSETTTYYVALVSGRCESERVPVQAVVGLLPTPSITALGPLTFCDGESVTLQGPDGFESYHWSNGLTSQQVVIATSSTLTLRVGAGNCLSDASEPVAVAVATLEAIPDITIINDILVTPFTPEASYQWYDQDVPIANANTHYLSINFTVSGHYVVEVSIGECGYRSLPLTYIYNEKDEESGGNGRLAVYPNPFQEQLHLQGAYPLEEMRIEILDLTGRKKFEQILETDTGISELRINTADWPPGCYVLMMYDKESDVPRIRRIFRQN